MGLSHNSSHLDLDNYFLYCHFFSDFCVVVVFCFVCLFYFVLFVCFIVVVFFFFGNLWTYCRLSVQVGGFLGLEIWR